jgi:hypothetical protein
MRVLAMKGDDVVRRQSKDMLLGGAAWHGTSVVDLHVPQAVRLVNHPTLAQQDPCDVRHRNKRSLRMRTCLIEHRSGIWCQGHVGI